jgi:hypothetical protein
VGVALDSIERREDLPALGYLAGRVSVILDTDPLIQKK